MKGIDAARQWFESAGLPLLKKECPEALPYLAAGLAGHGSECFGFDDEISRDHDFTAGFSLWIPEEKEPEYGFRLTRLYTKLLKENPPPVSSKESLLAKSEYGLCTVEDFYRKHIGISGVPNDWRQWLSVPEYAFAEATNGAVFYDACGIFSKIRNDILTGMPEDVRKKKLAARAAMMAQTGQYNFSRCLKRREYGAAGLAIAEFVRSAISMLFLLNKRFAPYYKWMFRGLRNLPLLSDMADPLEFLLTEQADDSFRIELVETICARIVEELKQQGLTGSDDPYMEVQAREIMSRIENREIRSLHLMEG